MTTCLFLNGGGNEVIEDDPEYSKILSGDDIEQLSPIISQITEEDGKNNTSSNIIPILEEEGEEDEHESQLGDDPDKIHEKEIDLIVDIVDDELEIETSYKSMENQLEKKYKR